MTPIRKGFLVFCTFFPFTLLAQAPGDLDSTFSGDGKLFPDSIASGGSTTGLPLIRVQGGKLLYYRSSRILRLMDDGSLDSTFGQSGTVEMMPSFILLDLVVPDTGGFLAIGRFADSTMSIGCIAYGYDGSVDPTYGQSGSFQLSISGCGLTALSCHLMSDRRLLISAKADCAQDSGLIVRLTPNGLLDSTFAGDGTMTRAGLWFNGIAARSDGTLTVSMPDRWLLIPPDGTFPTLPIGAGASSVFPGYFGTSCDPPPMAMNTQDMLVSRETQEFFGHFIDYLVKIMEPIHGGAIHTYVLTWSSLYTPTPFYGDLSSVAVDAGDGFLVTSGRTGSMSDPWQIWRFNSDGTRDSSFAVNGLLETEFSPGENCLARSICVQPDGKFVVAGWATIGGVVHAVIARYHNIPDPRTKLSARVFLGGPYNPVIERMHDSLRTNGLLPNSSPYPGMGFTAVNAPAYQTMHSGVMDFTGDSAIVDWVWLELLDAADTATVRAARAALLRRDGLATGMDGRSPVDFNCGAGTFFLRVRHRNHLGTTCSAPVTLGAASTSLDLTSVLTPTFGTQAQHEINGRRMLWPGDANGDGMVKYSGAANDRDVVLLAIGGTTVTATLPAYHGADVNLDGLVKYAGLNNDRDRILLTIGGSIPTAVRLEQVP